MDFLIHRTRVAHGVMAPYHQRLFNLRIDPPIGGHKNSLVVSDSEALPWDFEVNTHGVGYITQEEIVQRAGFFDFDNDMSGLMVKNNQA